MNADATGLRITTDDSRITVTLNHAMNPVRFMISPDLQVLQDRVQGFGR